MSYLAIYRRFRPQTFDEIVGQETVVKTLINQIKNNMLGHAYLFCGARGTGKTTAAKIFARAINCQNQKNGSPCGECETCIKMKNDAIDIIEMDAASNNGVDNIREIKEKVQYLPVIGKYKVYIIDEAHMLSGGAFNALLKTLEEPPKHVVFILATTEPNKLPATILSRCMRFDFKLIAEEEIVKHVSNIYDKLGKKYEKEAVVAIARAGEGSVRDALSVAEVCLSSSNEVLKYSDVLDALGASDKEKTLNIIQAVFSNNSGLALQNVNEVISLGKSVSMLTKDVLQMLRDVMIVKTCQNPNKVLSLPESDISKLINTVEKVSSKRIVKVIEIISSIENDIKYSTHPRIIFEAAVVKASTEVEPISNNMALIERIEKLEKIINSGVILSNSDTKAETNNIISKTENTTNNYDKTEITDIKPISNNTVLENESLSNESISLSNVNDSESNTIVDSQNNLSNNPILEIKTDILPNTPEESFAETKSKIDSVFMSDLKNDKVAIADRRIWGTVIKMLREKHLNALWAMCQELVGKIENGKLVIMCNDESCYNSLIKPDNNKALQDILSSISSYAVEIKFLDKVDDFSSDVEIIKQNFEDVEIIK